MAIPLAAIGLFTGATQLGSSFMQAGAIKSQARWESGQLENNAKLMDFQGKEAIRMGEKEAQQRALQVKKLAGRQRAVAAAQGIDVDSGSALDISQETAGMGALDIATIRNNAWKQAWGFQVQATNLRSQANMTRIQGKYNARQTLITGGMKAAGSIMSGFSSAGSGAGGGSTVVGVGTQPGQVGYGAMRI